MERGRARRDHRRGAAAVLVGAAAVAAVAVPLGLSAGASPGIVPAASPPVTRHSAQPAPTLPGTLAFSGTTEGLSWQIYVGLRDTPGPRGLPMACMYLYVSGTAPAPDCGSVELGQKYVKAPGTNPFDGMSGDATMNGVKGGLVVLDGTMRSGPAKVTVLLPDGRTYSCVPASQSGVTYYAVVVPNAQLPVDVIAYDAAGHELGRTDITNGIL